MKYYTVYFTFEMAFLKKLIIERKISKKIFLTWRGGATVIERKWVMGICHCKSIAKYYLRFIIHDLASSVSYVGGL